jgi:pimeloyl-ACP methyl ester carboxylesterase
MRLLYCTCAILLALPGSSHAQPAQPSSGPTAYTVFFRGVPIGREDVTVTPTADGTTVVTEGRMSAPADLVIRRAEFRYGRDWTPVSFSLEADSGGADVLLNTTVTGGTAVTEGSQAGKPVTFSHPISERAVLHANGIFGSYVALARRLGDTAPGTELRIYVVPQTEIVARVRAVTAERMQIADDFLDVRRYDLVFVNPSNEIAAQLTTDSNGQLLRVSIPEQALTVARADLAASTARIQVYSNPGDEPVTVPAVGFNLAGTLTRPAGAKGRLPTVVLLGGSGADDRDGFALGAPTLGQLAGALAEAGFLTLRYDKRGYGQSGGRAESATLADYAEDVRSIYRWLSRRDDVDPKRVALLGHGDGAWVALLAATREKKFAAVVSVAGPASTGSELILEQQQRALDQLTLTPQERDRRVALQKQILAAAGTGRGWDDIPPAVRKQADTPWFQSLVKFDPAKVLEDVRQPLLFLHGELDTQIPAAHADELAALAREESDSKSIEVVVARGVNHLLVPPGTAGAPEPGAPAPPTVSRDATAAIAAWLTTTFAAIR